MAAPTAPSLTSITTEGLKKAGYSNPSSAKLTHAQDEWMEEIKNDIFTAIKDPEVLLVTGYVTVSEGTQKYAFPSDFSYLESAKLLYGTQTGTAQAGGITSITLAAASTFTEEWLKGKEIYITGGTGSEQSAMVTAYNTTTKVATVPLTGFSTTPDNTSTYIIVDTEYKLDLGYLQEFDTELYPMNKSRPKKLYKAGDWYAAGPLGGSFYVLENPDATYGIRLRYYTDIMELDLASSLMLTLYRRWRNIWISGIKAKAFEEDDDDRAEAAMQDYKQKVLGLQMREKFGMTLSELQCTVDMG